MTGRGKNEMESGDESGGAQPPGFVALDDDDQDDDAVAPPAHNLALHLSIHTHTPAMPNTQNIRNVVRHALTTACADGANAVDVIVRSGGDDEAHAVLHVHKR